jgi:hypothetical protein
VAAINTQAAKEELYIQVVPLTLEELAWKHTRQCRFIKKSFDQVLGLN